MEYFLLDVHCWLWTYAVVALRIGVVVGELCDCRLRFSAMW